MTAYKIQGVTQPGRRLIAMAEEFAGEFDARAEQHDREGSFPFENLEALKESGYLYATVPVEYGGMGVESAHDATVASSRLAEGDASLTLGVNMHQVLLLSLARQWRIACNREDGARAAGLGAMLKKIVDARDDLHVARELQPEGVDLSFGELPGLGGVDRRAARRRRRRRRLAGVSLARGERQQRRDQPANPHSTTLAHESIRLCERGCGTLSSPVFTAEPCVEVPSAPVWKRSLKVGGTDCASVVCWPT